MANKTVISDTEFKTYVEGCAPSTMGTVYMNDNSKYWMFTKEATDKIKAMCVIDNDVQLWIYNGTDWIIRTNKTAHITTPTISSLPITLYYPEITSNMVVSNAVVNTPSCMTSDWTWTTADGSFTISGTISGSTTIDFDFYEPTYSGTATTTAS